jgi:hypothetical protein
MRLSALIFSVLSVASFVTADLQEQLRLQLNLGSQQDDSLKVPGENPLYFCSKPDKDILVIEGVDLDPNPPAA